MSVPEKHRAVAHAWVDGAEIETATAGGVWVQLYSPGFVESCEYRIKPKPKVKKWRWVAFRCDESLFVTTAHYSDAEKNGYSLLQKIDSTMIEVYE